MKKNFLYFTLLAAISTSALAVTPSAQLQISGDIKPPTCTINSSNNTEVVFDYGRISPSLIPQSSNYQYVDMKPETSISIECDAKTYLTFIPTDTYGDVDLDYNTSFDSAWFRLVDKANPDKAVGASFFNWKDATVDGKTAFISRATPKTAEVGVSVLVKNNIHGWTSEQQEDVSAASLKLVSGEIFTTKFIPGISSHTFILSRDKLAKKAIDISNGLDFIGEAVLTFSFGV